MIRRAIPFLAAFAIMAAAGPFAKTIHPQEKHLDVPYVTTRYPVVDEMLKLAAVNEHDVLYDLGCGDGRIVIAAARKYGARGIGIDIDPERIAECRKNAAVAGVGDRVTFIEGNLFQADFHEATVMAFYLLTSVNLRLRPKLLAELRPGSRIVSHNFMMGTWKPDVSSEVEADELGHTVYMWIVPANVSGTWTWATAHPKAAWKLTVEQDFQFAVGRLMMNGSEIPLKEISIRGDRIKVTAEGPGGNPAVSAVFEGKAFSNSISGKAEVKSNGLTRDSDWNAARNPATGKPLDTESHHGIFSRIAAGSVSGPCGNPQDYRYP
jgi:SAM-dependent methyltransferase